MIVAVGNDLRGDDGVACYIAEKMEPKTERLGSIFNGNREVYSQVPIIVNAGNNPENVIDEIVLLKPLKVIIIDAANFQGGPGEARIIKEEQINSVVLSTHMFPLGAVAKLIKEDTGAEVVFLGIQPKNMELGDKISDEVKNTANEIIKCVTQYQEK